jgi:type III secretion system low calcium response chaperone LcrH/SycD
VARFGNFKLDPAAVPELLRQIQAGKTFGPMLGHSVGMQRVMYHHGHAFYTQGKYEEAIRVFGFLVIADHFDRRYHMGMAACLHMLKRYVEAARYYGIAWLLDLTDPAPPMHAAECQLAIGDRAQARKSLEHALVQARAHARHGHHIPRLEAMLSLVEAEERSSRSSPGRSTQ